MTAPGSTPAPTHTELRVAGMNCQACARKITTALQAVPGVHSVSTQVEGRRASVRWQTGAAAENTPLLLALKAAGYDATVVTGENPCSCDSCATGPSNGSWHFNLWLGGFVTAALMLGEWLFHLSMTEWFRWLAFALAGAVQVFCGAQFYRGAWRQFRAGRSNMDTLVALGSTTAFAFSVWVLFSGGRGHVYFMEAAAIITLISLGHWLETRMSERAAGALKKLLRLAPQTARRRDPARGETDVAVSELRPGDLVLLRPGDRVPVDGVVVEGDSAVDEAMLTGESLPVEKSVQGKLYAGTANLSGRLVMRVMATGAATALAHIIAAVQRAQSSRANIQRLGDRVSNVFVPLVIFAAAAAMIWWAWLPGAALQTHQWLAPFLWPAQVPATPVAAAFIFAAAVLIVACPCAMGLATPAAIMAGANAAARRGILIRDGVALEKAGEVTAVVFDKTGTLTRGLPEVAASCRLLPPEEAPVFQTNNSARMDAIAAALARNSTHPVSRAVAKVSAEEILFTEWREVRGSGVEGLFSDGSTVRTARLGSLAWLRETGVNLAAGETFASVWAAQGATVVGLALDDVLCGLFAVRDTLKPGARAVVEQLRRRRLKIYLLTGDHARTATGIACQAGIAEENVFAEVRPEQKAEFVRRLQGQGERVAFVGDGINDAPALTQADLGVAVSRASDVAHEAADIILLKSEIEAVPEALGLAQATLRTIKQNLFWAFFYNAAGIPLAALGFMSPILCAAAMGFSDLVVIGNALRLTKWRLQPRRRFGRNW